jgi:hypothetical protein
MNSSARKLIPLYTTKGDVEAFLAYPYVFNRTGDWIGFITPQREIHSVMGYYVGYLSDDKRIIRKRATNTLKPRLDPPPSPGRISPPATVPLAPLMRELTHSQIDVLLDEPERLHTRDSGELREDMD